MPVVMKGNYIFVERGRKCFEISSNYTNYLELGIREITKYYFEAKIEGDEFRVSGILLDRKGEVVCHLKDNFVEPIKGKGCNKEMTSYGYRILDEDGNLIFEIKVERDLICHLKGTIYGTSGEIIAQDKESDFVVLKGPAIIGRSGNAIGIKLG